MENSDSPPIAGKSSGHPDVGFCIRFGQVAGRKEAKHVTGNL
jgi:hypothetical protein